MTKRKLKCTSSRNRTGFAEVSMPLLDHLPDKLGDKWLAVLHRWAKNFSTPAQAFHFQRVTTFWLDCHKNSPMQFPLPPFLNSDAHGLLKNLRRAWYEYMINDQKVQIDTTSVSWTVFLNGINLLMRNELFPLLNLKSNTYRAYPVQKTRISRGLINSKTLNDNANLATIDVKNDSYHSVLLAPLSIHLSDNEYLAEYEKVLRSSIDAFYSCANHELEKLISLEEEGKRLIDSVDYDLILRTLDGRRRLDGRVDGTKGGYTDPSNGKNWFNPKDNHPSVFANNLALVKREMGDLPQPYVFETNERKTVIHGKSHWRFPIQFGREKLFSHLGILTCRNAIPLIVLLLLDHPRINV